MVRAQHAVPNSPASFVDQLQSRGRYTFTRSDLAKAVKGGDVALDAGLRRLRKRRRIVSPRRGFHVIVPIEHSEAGGPPANWFIDSLMNHLGQPYYVGLLSAAALHGAAHQQPMIFQVVSDRPMRAARAGRARVSFHRSRSLDATKTMRVPTETGTMWVSTPEETAFDLVRFVDASGGLDNVATVLRELAERVEPKALVAAARHQSAPIIQRLGHLLDQVGERKLADELAHALEARRHRQVLLAPGRPARRARLDERWRLRVNVAVEPDE